MRTLYITLIALMASVISEGQHHAESLSPSKHLLAVNAQWEGKTVSQNENISFYSDTERIAYHLAQVIERLETESIQDPQIAARRSALLHSLKEYQLAARFPINTRHSERTPYFIDDFGTACAVGHLMIESGHEDLALKIKEEHNFDYIADIQTEGVLEWAEDFGFSLDELALIQPAYAPSQQMSAVGNGVNGPVSCMTAIFNDRMYIAGEFDIMDGSISCETGLGYYQDETYHCLENGPNGEVMDMIRSSNYDLMVAGTLTFGGENFPLAKLSNETWEFISIPDRPYAIGKAIRYTYNQYSRYLLCIDPVDGSGSNEVWRWNEAQGGSWHLVLTTDGPIHTLTNQSYDYIGGDFDTYIDHLDNDQIVETDGLLKLNLNSSGSDEAIPFQSEFLPDAVTTLLNVGEILYIGGTCDDVYPNTYLTRLQNNVLQALIYREENWGLTDVGLYDIDTYSDNQLLVAGDMSMDDFGTIGNNLGTYNLLGGYLSPLALLDSPIRSIASFNGDWYVGGEFTNNIGYPLNHIAKIGSPNGLIEDGQTSLTLSPNPAQDYFDIRFEEPIGGIQSMQIYGLDGRTHDVSIRQTDQVIHVEVQDLKPGVYLYTVGTEKGTASGRFVKE